MSDACPCGLPKTYSECCGLYHRGEASAPTAEALMRSRYSAYVKKDGAYLRRTTDPQTRHVYDFQAQDQWAEQSEFLGLEILKVEDKGNKAIIEFKARFRMNNEEHLHHEISRFRSQSGEWFYREGREPKG